MLTGMPKRLRFRRMIAIWSMSDDALISASSRTSEPTITLRTTQAALGSRAMASWM